MTTTGPCTSVIVPGAFVLEPVCKILCQDLNQEPILVANLAQILVWHQITMHKKWSSWVSRLSVSHGQSEYKLVAIGKKAIEAHNRMPMCHLLREIKVPRSDSCFLRISVINASWGTLQCGNAKDSTDIINGQGHDSVFPKESSMRVYCFDCD